MRVSVACAVLLAVGLAAGCANRQSSLASTELRAGGARLGRVGVVMAGTHILHLHEGKLSTPDDQASQQCASCVMTAVEQTLADQGYVALEIPCADEDCLTLLAAYGQARDRLFTALGSEGGTLEKIPPLPGAVALCAKHGVDALVLVGACDRHNPGGTRTTFWGGAIFRVSFGRGAAYADLAALSPAGKVLYYGQRSGSYCSLTDKGEVHEVFGDLVTGLALAAGRAPATGPR